MLRVKLEHTSCIEEILNEIKQKFNWSTLLPWSKFCFVSLYKKSVYAFEAIKTENKFDKDKTEKVSKLDHVAYVNSTQIWYTLYYVDS